MPREEEYNDYGEDSDDDESNDLVAQQKRAEVSSAVCKRDSLPFFPIFLFYFFSDSLSLLGTRSLILAITIFETMTLW